MARVTFVICDRCGYEVDLPAVGWLHVNAQPVGPDHAQRKPVNADICPDCAPTVLGALTAKTDEAAG